jgi:fructokinase
MRDYTRQLLEAHPHARRFYDINLRPGCYTPELVAQLLAEASVIKLNEAEVDAVVRMTGQPHTSLEEFCRRWPAVCVTRGAAGCAIWLDGSYCECPGYHVPVADTVGAGDAFSAAFLHGLSQGWPPDRIGDFANRLGAIVASRRGATPSWSLDEVLALQS